MRYHCHLIAIVVFTMTASLVSAQTNTRNTNTKTTNNQANGTTTKQNKVDKNLDEANESMDNATETTEKAKNTLDRFSKIFKPKTANEAIVIIPDIEFEDENLEKLLDAVKDLKDVKKASLDYTDGVATINATLKNKATTDFWTDLPKDIRAIFKMKSKKETSILVAYQKNKEANTH